MRGLPRSGKSTWVKNYLGELREVGLKGVVVSADDHHVNQLTGKYEYDPSRAGLAHLECRRAFHRTILEETRRENPEPKVCDCLIVDNTNLHCWELGYFWDLAAVLSVGARVVRCHCPFETALRRTNDHAVPDKTLWHMWQTLLNEKLPPHWAEEIVHTG